MRSALQDRVVFDAVSATVAAVHDINPVRRRLTFIAPRIADAVTAGPDQRIKVLLPPPSGAPMVVSNSPDWYATWRATPAADRFVMRTYTIRGLRPEVAELDVEFELHEGDGPAARFAAQAAVGQTIGLRIPFVVDRSWPKGLRQSGVDHVPPADSVERLLIADATALPALAGILEELPAGIRATALVAVADRRDIRPLDCTGEAGVVWLPQPGRTVMDALTAGAARTGTDYAWVAGEAGMVKKVRRQLVRAGLPKSRISFQGYWQPGQAES